MAMTISILKELIENGEFHHATYRDFGTLWEGLWIYRVKSDGFRGYFPAGAFLKSDSKEELREAEKLCKGVHVGSYGNG